MSLWFFRCCFHRYLAIELFIAPTFSSQPNSLNKGFVHLLVLDQGRYIGVLYTRDGGGDFLFLAFVCMLDSLRIDVVVMI